MALKVGKTYTGKQVLRHMARDHRRQMLMWMQDGNATLAGFFAGLLARDAFVLHPELREA